MSKILIKELLWQAFVDLSHSTLDIHDDPPATELSEDQLFILSYLFTEHYENVFNYVMKETLMYLILLGHADTGKGAYVRRPKPKKR